MKQIQNDLENLRSPPPTAPPCLDLPRPSSQKGGTLIAEEVTDIQTHQKWIRNPDYYRPKECPNCQNTKLHMHERRNRRTVGDPNIAGIEIAIFLCFSCRAVWRILPGFMARYLWRTWRVVEAATGEQGTSASWPKIATRTRERWKMLLRCSATSLVQIFATTGERVLEAVAQTAGLLASRGQLVAAYAAVIQHQAGFLFSDFAALIHRLGRGPRLM